MDGNPERWRFVRKIMTRKQKTSHINFKNSRICTPFSFAYSALASESFGILSWIPIRAVASIGKARIESRGMVERRALWTGTRERYWLTMGTDRRCKAASATRLEIPR